MSNTYILLWNSEGEGCLEYLCFPDRLHSYYRKVFGPGSEAQGASYNCCVATLGCSPRSESTLDLAWSEMVADHGHFAVLQRHLDHVMVLHIHMLRPQFCSQDYSRRNFSGEDILRKSHTDILYT